MNDEDILITCDGQGKEAKRAALQAFTEAGWAAAQTLLEVRLTLADARGDEAIKQGAEWRDRAIAASEKVGLLISILTPEQYDRYLAIINSNHSS
jgi:hypothetical protein